MTDTIDLAAFRRMVAQMGFRVSRGAAPLPHESEFGPFETHRVNTWDRDNPLRSVRCRCSIDPVRPK